MPGLTNPPSYAEDLEYASYSDRLVLKSLVSQPGVVETEDYKVSAGSGLQVNIKSGNAIVAETKATQESSNEFYNGYYQVGNPSETNPYNSVVVSSANPQIAQIILRIYDVNELKISGSSYGRLEWLNGTPTASATETKMKEGIFEGAAELAQSSLRLARVLVPKNATKSSEFYIEDARSYVDKAIQTRTVQTFVSWGTVQAAGSIESSGTNDWSVTRTGTGIYKIKWLVAKSSSKYGVLVTAAEAGDLNVGTVPNFETTGFEINMYSSGTGLKENLAFTFQAMATS